jgi:predicted HNH restriction endonuclease
LLGGEPPYRFDSDGEPAWFSYLAQWEEDESGVVWIMFPELASALEELGLGKETPGQPEISMHIPEEIPDDSVLFEGAKHRILVNAYERNPQARQRCIEDHGAKCCICGFDFAKTYGEVGKGFIHVHHLIPISEISTEYQIDPVRDLRPICPNCHAIIHRKNPPYSIEEVQEMLLKQSGANWEQS